MNHFIPSGAMMLCLCSLSFARLDAAASAPEAPALKPVQLRTEYLVDPLGMDEAKPRFSYRLEGTALRQSARRILVTDETAGSEVWDSGWVNDGGTIQIEYGGAALKPFHAYRWTVSPKDETGLEAAPAGGRFETGFLGTPWTGKWIGTAPHKENLQPVAVFRGAKTFSGEAVQARLYITALGLYRAYLNGKPVSEDCFTPGWTDYYNRVQYQAYDVTEQLRAGQSNVLAVKLAEGWYAGRISRFWSENNRPTYGDQPVFKAELRVVYLDGSVETLATDDSWEWKNSEIVMSDIYDGEHVKAFQADPAWLVNPPEKKNAVVYAKTTAVEWQSGAPVRRMHTLKPVSITKRTDGEWIVDFGQNFTGRERFTLRNAKQGDKVRIRHAEMLNPDGTLYTANLRSAKAETIYEPSNAEEQTFEPEFTFYGFRYLGVTGWPGELTADMISGISIYSALEETGRFHCSNPSLNQLYSNIVWGQRGNFLDVPTDCPQRDERLGWTADTQVFTNAATYNMDAAPFYTKWIHDLNLCRADAGGYPSFAPDQYKFFNKNGKNFFGYASGWSDAGLIVPWIVYTKYGDTRLLARYFDNMVKWLDFQEQTTNGTYLVKNAVYADWLNMNAPLSEEFVSTAYFAAMNTLAARIARVIGRSGDAVKRDEIFRKTKEAFRKRFLDENGNLKERTQTAALFALQFNLCGGQERANVLSFLISDLVDARKTHLSTGFLGTPLLLGCLAENGKTDLAYKLLEQKTFPSWLYPVEQGATTMWERWDSWTKDKGFGDVSMNSFNHYAYGAVADWFFESICGIQPIPGDPSAAGFKRFRLAPIPGGSLTGASASYDSMYGRIESEWKIQDGMFVWRFTVPCNTTAEVVFPTDKQVPVISGLTRTADPRRWIARPGTYHAAVEL